MTRVSLQAPRWRAPYCVETARLQLRALGPEHLALLHEVIPRNKAHLAPSMPWVQDEPLSPAARTELLTQMRGRFDLGLDFTYGIFERAKGQYVGGTGLHPRIGPDALEIGYWIDAQREGHGLVTEAARALCVVAFELMGAQRVEIRCATTNHRSSAVPQRLRFNLDGVFRKISVDGCGNPEDRMIWTQLASEHAERAALNHDKPRVFDVLGAPIALPSTIG